MVNVYGFNIECSDIFVGKSHSTMQNVVQNEEKITLKQMFDITAQTIHNEEEIYCLDKVVYRRIFGRNCR